MKYTLGILPLTGEHFFAIARYIRRGQRRIILAWSVVYCVAVYDSSG